MLKVKLCAYKSLRDARTFLLSQLNLPVEHVTMAIQQFSPVSEVCFNSEYYILDLVGSRFKAHCSQLILQEETLVLSPGREVFSDNVWYRL